jgi:hypothetical protein
VVLCFVKVQKFSYRRNYGEMCDSFKFTVNSNMHLFCLYDYWGKVDLDRIYVQMWWKFSSFHFVFDFKVVRRINGDT